MVTEVTDEMLAFRLEGKADDGNGRVLRRPLHAITGDLVADSVMNRRAHHTDDPDSYHAIGRVRDRLR